MEFKYNSWQEEGNSIRTLPYESVIHTITTYKFVFDPDAGEALENFHEYMNNDAQKHDCDVKVYNVFEVPGMEKCFCGTSFADGDKRIKLASFLCSWKGCLIYILLTLIGYKSVFDAIWFSYGVILRIKLIKRISMNLKNENSENDYIGGIGLRAGYLENDNFAKNKTFKSKSYILPKLQDELIFQPLLNYSRLIEKQTSQTEPYLLAFLENIIFIDNNNEIEDGNFLFEDRNIL